MSDPQFKDHKTAEPAVVAGPPRPRRTDDITHKNPGEYACFGASAEATVFVGCDLPIDCNHNGVYDALDLYHNTSVDCNRNGIPDECDAPNVLCPPGTILAASPPNWTIDARQPHFWQDNSIETRQGIGTRNRWYAHGPEPIIINLGVHAASCPACWDLCETGIEQVKSGGALSPNLIASVTELPDQPGIYELFLNRPISAGHWTTIRYLGGVDSVTYASLPGNANADMYSAGSDILDLIDCCLNRICTPRHGFYSCDIDNDGSWAPSDVDRLIELLNGAGTFITWYGKRVPPITCLGDSSPGGGGGGGGGHDCADSSCGGGVDPGAAAMVGSSQGDSETLISTSAETVVAVNDNTQFADWFANYLTGAAPTDGDAALEFSGIVESLSQWCVSNFTSDERAALAARLCGPLTAFASPSGSDAAVAAASAIAP